MTIPLEANVEVGDLLVLPIQITEETMAVKAFPIIRRGSHYMVAKDENREEQLIRYDHAIVLKKNGIYLIGENAE